MAYTFDPITNTLIDDEDKSLGNKLALLDPDLETAIQELNEKFGPGAVQQGTEGIPIPPKTIEREMFENAFKDSLADGGKIGGGIISGEDYGDRTGFAKPQLIIGGSRTDPKFRGKYGVRTNLTVPADTQGYLGRTGEQAVFATEADAQRFIDKDIKKLFLESQASKKRSPVIEARLEKIKEIYNNLKALNPKKIYLDDIIDQLKGEKTVFGTGKRGIQTEQTEIKAKTSFKQNIKEALGEKIYESLIKSPGEDPRVVDAKKAKFNKLVLDVNRGDLPIIELGSEARGTTGNIKQYLTKTNKNRFDKLLPLLRAINSRINQPRLKYTADDIKNISETTVKTFNKMTKNYPTSIAARTEVLKGGTRFFDAKSYILSQLARHVENGGNLFKHVSGNTIANVKFRDLTTNKFITFKNIDLNDPLFKEAATVYNDIEKLKNIKIDDPRNPGETITLNKALQEGGDKLVIDHLDEVQTNPLKKLVISTQKANMSGQIKNLTEPEINAIGRGLNLSFVDNLKRYKKYAERILLNKAANPEFKIKSPTETIKEKTGTFRGEAQNIKSKLDNFRFLTNKIPGGAVVLSPVDFTLSMFAGLPLTESLASAGSYLIKDPYLGKAVNIPLAIAQDMQDPEAALQKGIERGQKAEDFLQGLVEGAKSGAGDQPDIDPFQAAKGGRAKLNRGGGVEITPLPRSNFGNGGAAGADVDFATELEYFFTNPDAELPAMQTYKETNNPIKVLNDIINPRNYPYYADVLARAGIRIGEFGARLLPATGKLISDLIQKPAFKVKSTEDNYVRDYLDPPPPSNIKGTGIFSEFLENITPTTLEKKVGLDTLIKKEEQRLKDTGSTVGPKVFADTLGLGTEVAAPIFPGLKLLRAYAKKNNLPVNDVTQKLLVKEIDQVLDKQGMDRREFLQVTGAGATVILAKMLGFGDEIARTAKVAEKVAEKATSGGVPPYFFQLVEKIKRSGKRLEPEFDARVENNMQFENFVMKENMATGEISIQRTTEGGFNTGDDVIEGTISDELITYKPGETVLGKDGKYYRTADEYEEVTAKPDEEGKMKDIEPGLDSIEEIIELLPNKLKMSELENAGYNIDAFPDNIKQLLIDDLQKTN